MRVHKMNNKSSKTHSKLPNNINHKNLIKLVRVILGLFGFILYFLSFFLLSSTISLWIKFKRNNISSLITKDVLVDINYGSWNKKKKPCGEDKEES